MRNTARDNRPRVKAVKQIEVSEKHVKLRVALLIVCITVAIIAFAVFLFNLLNTAPGWRIIETEGDSYDLGSEFVFNYDLGRNGKNATEELRHLQAVYRNASALAYRLFDAGTTYDGYGNLASVNQSKGATVQVNAELYAAFSVLEEMGSRLLYLGPVYAEYENNFFGESPYPMDDMDPYHNGEFAAHLQKLSDYAKDPSHVSLVLLGNNTVRLELSEEYSAYLAANSLDAPLHFGWMRNAFAVDLMAEKLIAAGHTSGYLASYDGFTRNLDASGMEYSVNIFDRVGETVYPAARVSYTTATAFVYLRDYPLSRQDISHYHALFAGGTVHPYVDIETGLYKTALHNVVSYSHTESCAEVLLSIAPYFIGENFNPADVTTLTDGGIYTVWCDDFTVWYNGPTIALDNYYSEAGVTYTSKKYE